MTTMQRCYQLVQRPVVGEKASSRTFADVERKVYHFRVPLDANKVEIRHAVERVFKVKVLAVNTARVRAKRRRRGWVAGDTGAWKRAMVTLRAGDAIEIF
jgi:large subunit ribosomal protein L23